MSRTNPVLTKPSSIDRIAWFPINEGTGVAVADNFGNALDGTIKGTDTTTQWRDGKHFTSTGNADSGIKLHDSYIDELCRLDTMSNQSQIWFWNFKRPATVAGNQYYCSYGAVQATSVGGLGFRQSGSASTVMIPTYAQLSPGTLTYKDFPGLNFGDALDSTDAGIWRTMCAVTHVFDSEIYVDWYLHGILANSGRLIELEGVYTPTLTNTTGFALGGRGNSANVANGVSSGTGYKDLILFRTVGDERHNIPKWVKQMHYASLNGGIPDFLGA